MFVVRDCIHIKAPIERCFLLSTNIELMERAIGLRVARRGSSRRSGFLMAGDRIVWRGWEFGLPKVHDSVVTGFEPPSLLRETIGNGRFKRFEHELHLTEIDGHVLLTGSVRFSLPFGRIGRWVSRRVFLPRITEHLRQRLELLRIIAESEHWRRYLER